jgi:hypothetical protein
MTILIGLAMLIGWSLVASIIECGKEFERRRQGEAEETIIALHHARESARFHAWNLGEIADLRQATAGELMRVVRSDAGDTIEGTARGIEAA